MNGSFIDDARPTSTARTFVAGLLARPGHRKQQLLRPLAEKVAASASGLLVLVQWHPCLAVREHGVPETATKVVGPTLHRPP
jgi:hypothetical protein